LCSLTLSKGVQNYGKFSYFLHLLFKNMSQEPNSSDFTAEIPHYKLFGRSWKASNQRAVICIIHGFGEHLGRYTHVAQFLAQNGISSYALDLPGHGKSSGKRGVIRSLQDFILAVDLLYERTLEENPDVPIFLYGHSMGGGIVLRYLLLTANPPAGALITSPWLRLVKNPNAAAIVLGRIALNFGLNPVRNTKLNPDDLSRDTRVGKAYNQDALVHHKASLRLYFDLGDNGTYLMHKEFDFRTPVLLAHGTADKITQYDASVKLAESHQSQIQFKSWSDLRHETHNELNKDEVLQFYTQWILDQTKKPA